MSAMPPTYKFLAIPAPPLVIILPLLTPLLSVKLVTLICWFVCIVPVTSNSYCGLGLLIPTLLVLSTVITVVVVPALFILICKLEPLISCCSTPANPSTYNFNSLLIPADIPPTFLTLIGQLVMFSASLRITFAAVISTSFAAEMPGITILRAFSDIPLNWGTPSPATLIDDKFTPGLIPVGNPSIDDLGVNASVAITASTLPVTSTNTISYSLLSIAITLLGLVPVANPSAKSGPTNTHPEPANR